MMSKSEFLRCFELIAMMIIACSEAMDGDKDALLAHYRQTINEILDDEE